MGCCESTQVQPQLNLDLKKAPVSNPSTQTTPKAGSTSQTGTKPVSRTNSKPGAVSDKGEEPTPEKDNLVKPVSIAPDTRSESHHSLKASGSSPDDERRRLREAASRRKGPAPEELRQDKDEKKAENKDKDASGSPDKRMSGEGTSARKSGDKRKSGKRRTLEKRKTGEKRRTAEKGILGDSPGSPNKRKPKLVRKASHRGMINQLALQFPTVRRSFMAVKDAFEQFMGSKFGKDKSKHKIHLTKLGAILTHIADGKQFSDDEVRRLFNLADLDGSKTIEFREFLICVAMGYFLKGQDDSTATQNFKDKAKGFKVVEKAFKDMDDDGSNTVDAEELKKALFATAFKSESEVLEARFKELDFNGDGDVSFPEFLYGFAQWVGFGDDGDEEDDGKDEKAEGKAELQKS
jgi:Ca2+-binding EF-hand superfamily protein